MLKALLWMRSIVISVVISVVIGSVVAIIFETIISSCAFLLSQQQSSAIKSLLSGIDEDLETFCAPIEHHEGIMKKLVLRLWLVDY